MEIVRGVVIPTLIRGTEAEEKDKALKNLENRVSKQKLDCEDLNFKYRVLHKATSKQQAELNAFKSRVYLALAVLVAADAVFIMTLAKMLIK